MYAQVISGKVADPDGLRRGWDRWLAELAPGAEGWVDATGGVTSDGRFAICARFDDAGAARRNSERPEQDAWWRETSSCLDGEPVFEEGEDLVVHDPPDPSARFVQVMRAACSDRARMEGIEEEIADDFRAWRPDLLGAMRLWLPSGRVTAVDWFTSEEEARKGEQSEPPQKLQELFPQWMSLLSDQEWFDLVDPWHARAGGH